VAAVAVAGAVVAVAGAVVGVAGAVVAVAGAVVGVAGVDARLRIPKNRITAPTRKAMMKRIVDFGSTGRVVPYATERRGFFDGHGAGCGR
jgi:hypothetical protein